MIAAHTPMVVAAAQELCLRSSNTCNVDYDDAWKIYGDDYLDDAKAALDAAGAPELLEELKRVMLWIDNWSPEFSNDPDWPTDRDAARAAIAKAAGATT